MVSEWILPLLGGAFLAGLVDAVVGGGGLIQIPLLFAAFPGVAPATLFGTNKIASVFGTASATWSYSRRVQMPWRRLGAAAAAAFVGAFFGATTVSALDPALLRPLMLLLLVAMVIYTLLRPNLGTVREGEGRETGSHVIGLAIGGVIGFYDGFFGPGTGSFLLFLFVRFYGWDFLRASASAKLVNFSTNIAALIYFGSQGSIMVGLGLGMAVFNVLGAQCGAWLAMRHGSRFVRVVFLVVASVLIVKFAWDTVAGGFT